MATISNKNFLDFTKVSYADLLDQVNIRMNQESKFQNFRESAIAQIMLEIFVATTDLSNYYIERRAEEAASFETAKLRSSIISLSRQLSYIIQRPVPASSSLRIIIKGPLDASSVGLSAGNTISFPKLDTKFTYNGLPYILKKTYSYTFTDADIAGITASTYSKTINGSYIDDENLILNSQGNIPTSAILPISIVQGEITSATFTVSDGAIFQEYAINDTTFSNYYGTEDISYDSDTATYDLEQGFTKVGVGSSVAVAMQSDNLYEIDRRSILTSQTVLDSTSVSADIPKVCVIRTALNEGVEIAFGDGNISEKPTAGQIVAINYLSTEGANANETGVIGKQLTSTNTFRTSTNIDFTSNLEFRFNSNIVNGANMESIDSIKMNAPSLFYSLDRLVTKEDYIVFLKSLSTPINIKNAIAWGEQEESRAQGVTAIQSLCNVILFCALGSMYYKPLGGTYVSKSLSATTDAVSLNDVLLEGNSYSSVSEQTYFNILVKDTGVVNQLGTEESYPSTHPISVIKNKFKNKAQMTLRHIYVPPIIQDFYLVGTTYINNLSNLTVVQKKINNAIYDYLDEVADFNVSIYKSKLIDIIQSYPEVINVNLSLSAVNPNGSEISSFSTEPEIIAVGLDSGFISAIYLDEVTSYESTYSVTERTERNFYNVLCSNIYDALGSLGTNFRDSSGFISLMTKMNNGYKLDFRNNMLDSNGNIVTYSLKNEIPKIEIIMSYSYKN